MKKIHTSLGVLQGPEILYTKSMEFWVKIFVKTWVSRKLKFMVD